jgi:hypothetical protein
MHDSGQIESQIFSAGVPESGPPGRHLTTGESVQPPGPRPAMTAAELRLRAWTELPERHRDEVCRQIRGRCEAFVASIRVERIARKSEADGLVSEVVAHLLRATSRGRDEPRMNRASPQTAFAGAATIESSAPWPWLAKGRLDERDPAADARVCWLIEETSNRQALFHRFEDMRRRDRGGKWDGTGYPLVTVDDQTIEHLSGHYDPAEVETDSLNIDDSRRAWDGLVKLAAHQFGPDDDVVALLRVLGSDGETQDAFGTQWPIGKIVRALNGRSDDASWNDDRVENAKRRLTRCIAKIRQTHGLDAVDLRALLARYSREHDRLARDARRPRHPSVTQRPSADG